MEMLEIKNAWRRKVIRRKGSVPWSVITARSC